MPTILPPGRRWPRSCAPCSPAAPPVPHTCAPIHLDPRRLAILITVVSSTSCSVGKALQKEATRHLPRFSAGDSKILAQYLQSRLWLTGLAADVGGAVLQIAAFAMAPVRCTRVRRCMPPAAGLQHARCCLPSLLRAEPPLIQLHSSTVPPRAQVSIVQPISGVGLVGLALYSHVFLKERLHGVEWGAVALAFVGTLGLGATSGDGGSSEADAGAGQAAAAAGAAAAAAAAATAKAAAAQAGGADTVAAAAADAAAATAAVAAQAAASGGDAAAAAAGSGEPGALRMLGVLLLLAAGVLAVSVARNRRSHRQRRDRPAAAAYGLQAGACFGLSAASCRIGALPPTPCCLPACWAVCAAHQASVHGRRVLRAV